MHFTFKDLELFSTNNNFSYLLLYIHKTPLLKTMGNNIDENEEKHLEQYKVLTHNDLHNLTVELEKKYKLDINQDRHIIRLGELKIFILKSSVIPHIIVKKFNPID